MMVIYKTQIGAYSGIQNAYIPEDAIILKTAEQNGGISIWYLSDIDEVPISRPVRVLATGEHNYEDDFLETHEYLDTVIMNDGLVWRVFIERV